MFDWMDFNHDGSVDSGEQFMAYMQYKETFDKDDEDSDEDEDEDK